ncbi:unnamed protein product [Diabrotica balteata]|uniref:Peptidase M12B domain-containing protein n=1 Tax=Diabrotica balteata TaxID=107213 RepID=A0A9N9XEG2_DIABA|nr:unnamed protein product [Diabrotica balteata]
MGKYLFRERRLPVYDVAVAITKLGAVHDGSPPPSYLGGPGAEKCQWTDGFIMSDLRHTERGFRWSSCSVASFHHFLNGDTATCLYNAPHEDESLPRVLPGKLLTLDAQCRRDRGTSACFKDDRVCAQLFCFDAGSGYCVAYRPAAEGSPCGDGQYCLNGRCVAEHENIIPDYSQNTPSYVRSNSRTLYQETEESNQAQLYNDKTETSTTYKNLQKYHQIHSTEKSQLDFNPYQNSYSTTKKNSYQTPLIFNFKNFQTTTSEHPSTKFSFKFMYPQDSTTKSAYNFKQYSKLTTTQKPTPETSTVGTTNRYIGNYYLLRKQTTKNPYDFADFGKSTQSPYDSVSYNENLNNYLKRSYNDVSYFSDSNRQSVSSSVY